MDFTSNNNNKQDTNKEIRIGNIFGATGGNYAGMVYDKNGMSPSLNAMLGGYRQPMVIDAICIASRGRDNDRNDSDEDSDKKNKYDQHLEPRFDGNTNTITSVEKDNYVLEIHKEEV